MQASSEGKRQRSSPVLACGCRRLSGEGCGSASGADHSTWGHCSRCLSASHDAGALNSRPSFAGPFPFSGLGKPRMGGCTVE